MQEGSKAVARLYRHYDVMLDSLSILLPSAKMIASIKER